MIELGYGEEGEIDDPTVWILSKEKGKDLFDFVAILKGLNIEVVEAIMGETEASWSPFKSTDMNHIKLKELKLKILSNEIVPESALVLYTKDESQMGENKMPCGIFIAEKVLDDNNLF